MIAPTLAHPVDVHVQPMLGAIRLPLVQQMTLNGKPLLVQQHASGLDADIVAVTGRKAWTLVIHGLLVGANASATLKAMRDLYKEARSVSFMADAIHAAHLYHVLVAAVNIRMTAAQPDVIAYHLILRECAPQPAHIPLTLGSAALSQLSRLRVDVRLDGKVVNSGVRLLIQGETMSQQVEDDPLCVSELPAGNYILTATAHKSWGQAQTTLHPGETQRVEIRLQPTPPVLAAFMLHFDLNTTFVHPTMREVLARAAAYAQAHPDIRMVIRGHADAAETDAEPLANIRAFNVLACLLGDANQLGRTDTWRTPQQQMMLHALGFDAGMLSPDGNLTLIGALRAFQRANGLPETGIFTGETRAALLIRYLNLFGKSGLPQSTRTTLRIMGYGAHQPVHNTDAAHRPNRRVEILFIAPDTDDFNPAAPLDLRCVQTGHWVSMWGSVRRADSTPFPGARFVLATSTGETLGGEFPTGPDRGQPIISRADKNGHFTFTQLQPPGLFTFALHEPGFVARWADDVSAPPQHLPLVRWLEADAVLEIIAEGQPS
ncbi:MAG: hypothetical protein OHK0046_41980 [Anaerolineae bacterium]